MLAAACRTRVALALTSTRSLARAAAESAGATLAPRKWTSKKLRESVSGPGDYATARGGGGGRWRGSPRGSWGRGGARPPRARHGAGAAADPAEPTSAFEFNRAMLARVADHDGEAVPALFAEMLSRGLEPNVFSYNALIGAAKVRGDLAAAVAALHAMQEAGLVPDVVSYTEVMSAAFAAKRSDLGLKLYQQMRDAGIAPSAATYTVLVGERIANGDLGTAERLLGELRAALVSRDAGLVRSTVAGDDSGAGAESAHSTAHGGSTPAPTPAPAMPARLANARLDHERLLVIQCSRLVKAYAAQQWDSPIDEIERLFGRLERALGVKPDERMLTDVIAERARHRDLATARHYFAQIEPRTGARPSKYAHNYLLDALVAARAPMADVRAHFESMLASGLSPDARTLQAFVSAYLDQRELGAAWEVFTLMRAQPATRPDVVTYNRMLQEIVARELAVRARAALAKPESAEASAPHWRAWARASSRASDMSTDAGVPSPPPVDSAALLAAMAADRVPRSARTYAILLGAAASAADLAQVDALVAAMANERVPQNTYTFNLRLKAARLARAPERVDALVDEMTAAACARDLVTHCELLMCDKLPGVTPAGFVKWLESQGIDADQRVLEHAALARLDGGDADGAWALAQDMWARSWVPSPGTAARLAATLAARSSGVGAERKALVSAWAARDANVARLIKTNTAVVAARAGARADGSARDSARGPQPRAKGRGTRDAAAPRAPARSAS